MKRSKPTLSGVRVLVTRARQQSASLAELLEARGAKVTAIPVIEIRPPASYAALDSAVINIDSYDWLILTSVNGVEAFFNRLRKQRVPHSRMKRLKVAAIGPATKAAIEREGLRVAVMPPEYVAEAVVKAIRKEVKGRRVLLVRAKVARDVIPRELRAAGAEVDVVEAYQTEMPAKATAQLKRLFNSEAQRPHIVTFTSSSTAANFVRLLGGKGAAKRLTSGVALASIGPVTSATLEALGLTPTIEAEEYSIPGLVAAIEALVSE